MLLYPVYVLHQISGKMTKKQVSHIVRIKNSGRIPKVVLVVAMLRCDALSEVPLLEPCPSGFPGLVGCRPDWDYDTRRMVSLQQDSRVCLMFRI